MKYKDREWKDLREDKLKEYFWWLLLDSGVRIFSFLEINIILFL